jgi:DNA-binding HxlR family transcriptional regulator
VREKRSGRLAALMSRARRGSSAVTRGGGYGRLDWQKARDYLSPVRSRWDLAILSNLDPEIGRRPKDILAAVHAQAEADQGISPQVLSGRLRQLERDGYVRHADLSEAPLRRLYYLLPPGIRLIDDLLTIVGQAHGGRSGASVARTGR